VNVRRFTSTPVKSCVAADAAVDAAGADAAWLATAAWDGLAVEGLGLADEPQALNTRIRTVAAATGRYRDTTLALLLTDVWLSNILNERR
jgi:hypothetical protein